MYKEEYTRWVNEDLIDFDLGKELRDIADDEDAIKKESKKQKKKQLD